MRPTLQVIRDEHATLAAVLRSIGLLLTHSRRHGVAPDLQMLRAMLYYIDEFPEQVHHSKESALLFPRLRQRSVALDAVLARLDADHARSHAAVLALEHDVLALEMTANASDADARLTRFEADMQAYIAAYLEHIRVEERDVLPLAEDLLDPADWRELDAAFLQNRDPLAAGDDATFRPLFLRILTTLPAPLGLGPVMEAMQKSYHGTRRV